MTASDKASDDNFGKSIALDGTTALVGAPKMMTRGPQVVRPISLASKMERGARVLSSPQAMVLKQTILVTQWPFPGTVIGAYYNDGGADSGSAYIFTRINDAWQEGQVGGQ